MKEVEKSLRQRRHHRIRARIVGSNDRPRLSVRRTLCGMYVQLVDDENSLTLTSADWRELDKKKFPKNDVSRAHMIGLILAQKATKVGIAKIVFDRGGYAYHGKIKALAEGAREGGLQF
ncbi:MAG: 50S ribosomal protein L18 [Candidatus Moraniibacteriota bacterium]|nr:MAG: 50S ribosomal protein L18 [Candidatus Moranbacteria bacterium]